MRGAHEPSLHGVLSAHHAHPAPSPAICSRVTPVIDSDAPVWIELYPGHISGAVVDLLGEREAVPEMGFDKLLSTIDRARHFRVPV